MICNYCGEPAGNTTDETIDHFIAKHTTPVVAVDTNTLYERLRADMSKTDGGEDIEESLFEALVDDAMHQVERVVADQFPPASFTSRLYIPLTEDAAENMADWLHAQVLGLSEDLAALSRAEGWSNEPKSLRVTIRVEPVFDDSEKGKG